MEQIEERTAYLVATLKSSLAAIRNHVKKQRSDLVGVLLVFLFLLQTGMAFKIFGLPGLLLLIAPGVLVMALNRWDRNRKAFYRAIEAKISGSRASAKGGLICWRAKA